MYAIAHASSSFPFIANSILLYGYTTAINVFLDHFYFGQL